MGGSDAGSDKSSTATGGLTWCMSAVTDFGAALCHTPLPAALAAAGLSERGGGCGFSRPDVPASTASAWLG